MAQHLLLLLLKNLTVETLRPAVIAPPPTALLPVPVIVNHGLSVVGVSVIVVVVVVIPAIDVIVVMYDDDYKSTLGHAGWVLTPGCGRTTETPAHRRSFSSQSYCA